MSERDYGDYDDYEPDVDDLDLGHEDAGLDDIEDISDLEDDPAYDPDDEDLKRIKGG